MNTNYMQLLPTVASTGYENSASSAKKNSAHSALLKSALFQRAFQTRSILKFGVYIEMRSIIGFNASLIMKNFPLKTETPLSFVYCSCILHLDG